MIKISFIIPAYNATRTLDRCLNSIYNLSLNEADFEVLVVDDCSTDDTFLYLTERARKHANMQVLKQPFNQRQGAARNRGIKEAKGEYIQFVDADDEVVDGVLDALEYAYENKIDMLFCSTAWEDDAHQFIPQTYTIPEHLIISRKDFAEYYYNEWVVGPWTYLWRREFLVATNIPFVEGRRMEDYDFVEKHILQADRLAYTSAITYKYYSNQGSTVKTVNVETMADWIHVGYRCMQVSKTTRELYPLFAKRVKERSCYYIKGIMRLRNLSKYSSANLKQMKVRVGEEAWKFLLNNGEWNKETRFCFRFYKLITIVNYVTHPLTCFMRRIKNMIIHAN